MALTLTADQVAALAPDASSLKAARGLSAPRPWSNLGTTEQSAWGECQGSGSKPYRVKIDLDEPAFNCSCPSRKQPCKHGLGLLLLLLGQPTRFEQRDIPDWVAEWLTARVQRAEKKAAAPPAARRAASADSTRQVAREAKITAGLEEMEHWLHDLVRRGLASAQSEPPRFWETMAARLVDAQAPGLARLVRNLSGIPASGEGWPERLLERLGLLNLAVEGYRRLPDLPPPVQATLRTVVGWTRSQDEVLALPGLRDRWQVLGQRVEREDPLRVQRTWLFGETSGRAALLLDFAHGTQPFEATFPIGSCLDAELAFFPSSFELRALVKARYGRSEPLAGRPGVESIAVGLQTYAAALACNPWLEEFPLCFRSVIPARGAGGWTVQDVEERCLPLSPRLLSGWQLLALSGGRPLQMFGEWDGCFFLPLMAWNGDEDLRLLSESP